MDYIKDFDIRLGKEMYYAGETLSGVVILNTLENFKVRSIRVMLRGKAHTEWKVMISGDKKTVKDDQYFIDERAVIWGKESAEGTVPIIPRGTHQFPFKFQLPESSLPCSFESRCGTIRYYLKVTVDVPYMSPPQGMKYFTIIGPHIDVMDYLKPIRGETKKRRCCLCCESRRVSLRTDFERSAYVCGESLRVKADIDNQSEEEVRLKLRLVQYVEYYIDKSVQILGLEKEVTHTILEYRGAPVLPHTRTRWDAQQNLVVPTMPPTLVGVCRLIQIYYVLKVCIEVDKSDEELHMHFPITIATVPFRIPNSNQMPVLTYELPCEHAEGGIYIGPEFLLGQVYDGTTEFTEAIVLYRPVYPTVKCSRGMTNNNASQSQPSTPRTTATTASTSEGLKVGSVPKDIPPIMTQPKSTEKAGTSSSFASPKRNATLTNSNLISATQTTSTAFTSVSSTIPDSGQSTTTKSMELGKGFSASTSFSSVTATVQVHPDKQQSSKPKLTTTSTIKSHATTTATVNNVEEPGSSGASSKSSKQRPQKLHFTNNSNNSTSSDFGSGMHVSFDGESCTSTASKRTSSTSSSGGGGNEKSGKETKSKSKVVKVMETLDDAQVKSAGVDITLRKIETDETDANISESQGGSKGLGKAVKSDTTT